MIRLTLIVLLLLTILSSSWVINYNHASRTVSKHVSLHNNRRQCLQLSTQNDGKYSGTDDQILEKIKAELDSRGIDYSDLDVSTRSAFAKRLIDAQIKDLQIASGNDSNRLQVPGGLDQMTMNMLLNDPEVVSLLENPKMEEMISAIVNGGSAAKEFLKENPGMPLPRKYIQLLEADLYHKL